MNKRIPIFGHFELETCSGCHRKCPTCLRNSYPDREKVSDWFADKFMPDEVVYGLFDQLKAMKWIGQVNLQHYNEPLLDPRIGDFGRYVKAMHPHYNTSICTAGDHLNEKTAEMLKGAFNRLTIALYMDEERAAKRREEITPLFEGTITNLQWVTPHHTLTHFSPYANLDYGININADKSCHHPWWRMIINHRGEMMLCCDDMPGHFDLGNIANNTIEELWYSDKHQDIMMDLLKPGSRKNYAHCASCPRGNIALPLASSKWAAENGIDFVPVK